MNWGYILTGNLMLDENEYFRQQRRIGEIFKGLPKKKSFIFGLKFFRRGKSLPRTTDLVRLMTKLIFGRNCNKQNLITLSKSPFKRKVYHSSGTVVVFSHRIR